MSKLPIEYQSLVENIPTCLARLTAGTKPKMLFMNSHMRELFGYQEADVEKVLLESLFLERQEYLAFRRQLMAEGLLDRHEVQWKGKRKKALWCSLSATVIYGEKDKAIGIDLHAEDVSRSKRREEELIESKDMFQTVFNNTAAAILVTDKNERLVAWNPYAETLLGMDREDLFNKPIKELYPKSEWQRIRTSKMDRKGIKDDIETQVYRKDGVLREINLSMTVLKDLEGKTMGAIGIMRDITQQKTAERKIRESENKIRVILDNSAAGIILTDEEDKIVSWNKFTEELFGMKKKDLYLKHVSCLYPKEEWAKIAAIDINKTGLLHHFETKIHTRSGDMIDADLSVNVLRDPDNSVTGSVSIIQDITKQKRTQEMLLQAKLAAEEASSAKSLFLANMSHEVRTPINTVIGMIDLTLDGQMDEEQKENLEVAKDASVNLLGLLNDILDLSRVEAGKINLEYIEFHLHNVAHSVVKGMSVLALKKNLDTKLVVDKEVPQLVEGDPVRLRQVLVNLMNNAIKFTHKGTITTEIKVASQDGEDVIILFSVVDEGIGIPQAKQEKIFDIFSQADDSTTRRFGGTGLGLAISKRLTEMMGGRIWVESEEGKGSTFHFTARLKLGKHSSLASVNELEVEDTDAEALREKLKGLRVLLAEDNIVNQKIAVKLLEKQGWIIEAVDNGQDAVDKVLHEKFDVVLMDANMPILDGLEATKLIRDNERKTGKHIPIIALTARAMQDDKTRCINAGMDGYVAKPINRKELFLTIGTIINKGREHHE